jgi:hypothetical protein
MTTGAALRTDGGVYSGAGDGSAVTVGAAVGADVAVGVAVGWGAHPPANRLSNVSSVIVQ